MRRSLITTTALLTLGLTLTACSQDEGSSDPSSSGAPSESAPASPSAPTSDAPSPEESTPSEESTSSDAVSPSESSPTSQAPSAEPSVPGPQPGQSMLSEEEKASSHSSIMGQGDGNPTVMMGKQGATTATIAGICDGKGSMQIQPIQSIESMKRVGSPVKVTCTGVRKDATVTAKQGFDAFLVKTPMQPGTFEVAVLTIS